MLPTRLSFSPHGLLLMALSALQGSAVYATFKISATLCVPRDGKKRHILQLLTHGGGFNRKYVSPPRVSASE
jgi:hypothetical protein